MSLTRKHRGMCDIGAPYSSGVTGALAVTLMTRMCVTSNDDNIGDTLNASITSMTQCQCQHW